MKIKHYENRPCCLVSKPCLTLCNPVALQPTRLLCPWDSPGKRTGVGCHFLLQENFLTQRPNSCLLHWQVDSLLLSHQKSAYENICCSLAQSCPALCNPMDCSTTDFPVLHYAHWVCSNSCPLSQWCHPTVSSSVDPFSSCLQSFPASGSFPVSQLFASGSQSTGASASASVLSIIQDWFPSGLTDLISLQSKGLSRVYLDTNPLWNRDGLWGEELISPD